jgi:hypothetical protein
MTDARDPLATALLEAVDWYDDYGDALFEGRRTAPFPIDRLRAALVAWDSEPPTAPDGARQRAAYLAASACRRGNNPTQGIDGHWCMAHDAEWLLSQPKCGAALRPPRSETPAEGDALARLIVAALPYLSNADPDIIAARAALSGTSETPTDIYLHTQEADANGVWCREDGQRWPCDVVWTTSETPDPLPLDGVGLIAAERRRQVEVEGYDASHDAAHNNADDLALAGATYALTADMRILWHKRQPVTWPWGAPYWKPTPDDRMRELVKAGALIAAAIDRLAAARGSEAQPT